MTNDDKATPMISRQTIGKAIASLRNDKCLTQEQLADLAAMSQSRITEIETGIIDKRISSYISVCAGLGVSMSEVFRLAEHLDD
jgi:transcriptional regulator with XRE-family HTH domain